MLFINIFECYGVIFVVFYWLSVIIVYGMFVLGLWMVMFSYYDGWYYKVFELYKSIGILLMMGLVICVLWCVIFLLLGLLLSYLFMICFVVRVGYFVLYLLFFVIGISGYLILIVDGKLISVFGWFDVFVIFVDVGVQVDFVGVLYFWFVWSVVVLFVMYGFMVLKYYFIDKDDILKCMLGKLLFDYGV